MNDARFKRKKHGQIPGDVQKHVKIALREGKKLPGVSASAAKTFRNVLKLNQRAVQKRRALREMAEDR